MHQYRDAIKTPRQDQSSGMKGQPRPPGRCSYSTGPGAAGRDAGGEATIEVRPNDYLEAWQLHEPRNLRVVCSPGGDYVAVFEPNAQDGRRGVLLMSQQRC